ncbi:hypothetical protein GLOIN_2v1776429 [Rhizophagus clarus]|uniref:Uncharacterized protein n=1 Tax=Rhizophagus clarus TaxID=94130 RepID=A0A8H3R2W2_9GLOM|nr:hypothetical protein GLOIN_2v1776429 [Rhizophagus clarus]
MLRNKPRKANIATLPFRIRNNFRRLPNRFLLSDNDDNEKMVQKDFEDDNISGEEYNEYGDGDDDLEQRSDDDHIEQRSDNEQRNDNDDDLEQRSNNEEESDEEYETMSSDNEERHDSDISEKKLFVDEALAKDKLPSYDDLVDIIMRPEFNRDHIMAYQLSISDIIWNVLNNPSLLKEMYFGAGVDSKTKSEYWHGTLWAESPLFGQEQLMISGIYQCGDFVYYYDNERKLGRLRAILLNEENLTVSAENPKNEPFLTITTSQISEKVAADTLRITKILYKTSYTLAHSNVYHSLGEFEQGKLMEVNGQDAWVIAGLGVVTADLPQGNDMCGVLRHNANKGCRTCTASRESLTNFSQDVPATSRYHHITDDQFKEIFNEPATTRQRRLCTEFGLRTRPSILDRLLREGNLQTPQDVYHATAGKIGRLLKLTFLEIKLKGK